MLNDAIYLLPYHNPGYHVDYYPDSIQDVCFPEQAIVHLALLAVPFLAYQALGRSHSTSSQVACLNAD